MNSNKLSSRPLSASERAWCAFDTLYPPAINQFVLEGTGDPDPEAWQQAVTAASEVNPGSRLVLRGRLGWSRLVDSGEAPRVRVITGSQWSGTSPEGADFLRDQLSLRTGPSCEVLLLPGTPCRVIIRTLHMVMDGGGTMHWSRDIFHALNGRPLVGSTLGVSDKDIADSIESPPPGQWQRQYPAPTGQSDNDEDTITWRRITIEGSHSRVMPKIALYVAQRARTSPQQTIHVSVPVDMRKHVDIPANTGNLTGFLHVMVEPDSTPESITQQIHDRLARQEHMTLNPGSSIAVHLPIALLAGGIRNTAATMRKDGRYGGSAILSNMGRVDLPAFTAPDFQPRAGYYIPPGTGLSPAMMIISGSDNGVEVCVGMPTGLASHGRIEEFLQGMAQFLTHYDNPASSPRPDNP